MYLLVNFLHNEHNIFKTMRPACLRINENQYCIPQVDPPYCFTRSLFLGSCLHEATCSTDKLSGTRKRKTDVDKHRFFQITRFFPIRRAKW